MLRVVAPSGGDARRRRARQEVNATHQRTDQSFDVTADVRSGNGAKDLLDTVLVTPAPHRLRMKLTRVVHVQRRRNSPLVPFNIDITLRQPAILG